MRSRARRGGTDSVTLRGVPRPTRDPCGWLTRALLIALVAGLVSLHLPLEAFASGGSREGAPACCPPPAAAPDACAGTECCDAPAAEVLAPGDGEGGTTDPCCHEGCHCSCCGGLAMTTELEVRVPTCAPRVPVLQPCAARPPEETGGSIYRPPRS